MKILNIIVALFVSSNSFAGPLVASLIGDMESDGWWHNPWPATTDAANYMHRPVYDWGYDTTVKQGGARSLRLKITSWGTGNVHLYKDVNLQYGHMYRLKAYVRSDQATQVNLHIRQEGYRVIAQAKSNVSTAWTLIETQGVFTGFGSSVASVRLEVRDLNATVWVDSMTLEDLGAPQVLVNGGMESSEGWNVNAWGSPGPVYSWGYDSNPLNVHSGLRSLRFNKQSIGVGDAHIFQRYNFQVGNRYKLFGWIKSSSNASVKLGMREDLGTYDYFAENTMQATPTWKYFETEGVYTGNNTNASVRLAILTLGPTVWLDDVVLVDLGKAQLLSTGDFNTDFGGWRARVWPTPSSAVVQFNRETVPSNVMEGTGSLRYKLVQANEASAGANIVHGVTLESGKQYQFSAFIKSASPVDVDVTVRDEGAPYRLVMSTRIKATTSWQKVIVRGTYTGVTGNCAIRIDPKVLTSEIWVDQAVFSEIGNASLINNGGTEGQSGVTENRWDINKWNGATGVRLVESNPISVLAGQKSQSFVVTAKGTGDFQLFQPFGAKYLRRYRATAWIKAETSATVHFFLRRDKVPYDAFASKFQKVTTSWTPISIEGTFFETDSKVSASVRFAIQELNRKIWIDNVVVEELPAVEWEVKDPTKTVGPQMFGLHLNELGKHNIWPSIGQEVIRLWDTATTWGDLEPANNQWVFNQPGDNRFDYHLRHVRTNNALKGTNVKVLYTMGMNPAWAAINPLDNCVPAGENPHYGVGACSGPRNLEDWRDYVRTLGLRNRDMHQGIIKYWEIWNEVNVNFMYRWNAKLLVDMARIARDELKAIDPSNVILSPNFTPVGIANFSEFLSLGGAQYVDVISFHWYFASQPEMLHYSISNVYNVMRDYNVNKPLWNTEGAPACNVANGDVCTGAALPSLDQQWGVVPRGILLMAAYGIEMFGYYHWEREGTGYTMVEKEGADPIYDQPVGLSFKKIKEWIVGYKITSLRQMPGNVFAMTLVKGTAKRYIVWTTQATSTFVVPNWGVHTAQKLDGSPAIAVTTGAIMSLSAQPQLLE